jgi:hypothetical protein
MKQRGEPDKLYDKNEAHEWAKGLRYVRGKYVFHPYTLKNFKFEYDTTGIYKNN